MLSRYRALKLILLASAIFYLAFIFGTSFTVQGERYFTLVDDAMISMRYAKHFAQGYGFVWNVREAPVQGFTNFGWTLWMALFHLFPIPASKISLAIMLTSALTLLANIVVVHRLTQTLLPDSKYAPTLAALMTAFYFPLVFWSLRGMEVGLLVVLIDLAILLAITGGQRILLGVILALAILVRVDALLAAALILTFLLWQDSRRAIVPAIFVLAATLAIFWFQRAYFGDFLPTTYYQKLTGFTLTERVRHGLVVFNQFATRDTLLLFLLSLALVFFYKQQGDRRLLLLLGIFLIQCAYSIYVGGDYAEPETNAANRFVTQGMPPLIVLFSVLSGRLFSDLEAGRAGPAFAALRVDPGIVLGLIVLVVISGGPWISYAIDNAPLLKSDIRRVRLGLHIAANTTPDAVIAVHAAGQIPYFSDRTTIDLLGLNDPYVAKESGHGAFYPGHNKWDYAHSILGLRPDLIADNFAPLGGFMRDETEYEELESGIYIRLDSTHINFEGIRKDFR